MESACWTALIIAALYQAVLTSACEIPPSPKRARGGEVAPPPLDQLRTGGGDGCRNGVDGWGRAFRPSPWFEPPAGATDAGGASHSRLGLAERHRDEVRRVARLDAHEDRALAFFL